MPEAGAGPGAQGPGARWGGSHRATQCLLYRGVLPLLAHTPTHRDSIDTTDRQLEHAIDFVPPPPPPPTPSPTPSHPKKHTLAFRPSCAHSAHKYLQHLIL